MPAADEIVLGLNAFTAQNTNTTAAPVYAEINNLKDEVVNMDTDLSDITTRASGGFRLEVPTLSSASVDATMIYRASNTLVTAIKDAYFNKSRILMGFFDGDPADAAAGNPIAGFIGGFSVTRFNINRQLEEAMMVDVTFQVRDDDAGNGPQWVEYTADPNTPTP